MWATRKRHKDATPAGSGAAESPATLLAHWNAQGTYMGGVRTESWRNSTERIPYMYDRETVQRALDALEKGMTCAEAAEAVGVSPRSVQRWSRGQALQASRRAANCDLCQYFGRRISILSATG